jgi:hypothetical protein
MARVVLMAVSFVKPFLFAVAATAEDRTPDSQDRIVMIGAMAATY